MAKKIAESIIEGIAGFVAGCILGELANAKYESLPEKQKRQWEWNRVAHHGEIGCAALVGGVAGKSPAVAGLGLGFMVSDRGDSKKW